MRVLVLRMEEPPPMRMVAADVLNKQSRIAENGWSSSLAIGLWSLARSAVSTISVNKMLIWLCQWESLIVRGMLTFGSDSYVLCLISKNRLGCADKSLAQPGRKQATANKFWIYSTYSPTKLNTLLSPLLELLQATQKKSECCPSNQVSAGAMTSTSDEKWRPFNCLFSPGNQ